MLKNRIGEYIVRYTVATLGLVFIAIGVALSIKSDLGTIFGLVGDYLHGNYKKVSKTSLLLIIGSLLYLLNPMDIVPDFLIVILQ